MEELNALQVACKRLETGYEPQITYIIVGKRHHTRLFCADPRQQIGRGENVPPGRLDRSLKLFDLHGFVYTGTIVDKGICHFTEMDYFLCSHGGIQVRVFFCPCILFYLRMHTALEVWREVGICPIWKSSCREGHSLVLRFTVSNLYLQKLSARSDLTGRVKEYTLSFARTGRRTVFSTVYVVTHVTKSFFLQL